jgi:hypothetical protein
MTPREIMELGLLQVEHACEEDPDAVSALVADYMPGLAENAECL